jgi:hypothetical protein
MKKEIEEEHIGMHVISEEETLSLMDQSFSPLLSNDYGIPDPFRRVAEKQSLYACLLRWWVRDDLTAKLLLFPFLESFRVVKQGEEDPTLNARRMRFFLRATHLPQPEATLKHIAYILGGLEGARWTTQVIWPILFTGLFLHDFSVFFQYPSARYGNTLAALFAGASPNQLSWASQLGSDLVDRYSYGLGGGLLALSAMLGALFEALGRRYFGEPLLDSESFQTAHTPLMAHLAVGKDLKRLAFALRWDNRLTADNRKKLFEALETDVRTVLTVITACLF